MLKRARCVTSFKLNYVQRSLLVGITSHLNSYSFNSFIFLSHLSNSYLKIFNLMHATKLWYHQWSSVLVLFFKPVGNEGSEIALSYCLTDCSYPKVRDAENKRRINAAQISENKKNCPLFVGYF